jgi:hypothetical protein
MTDQGFARARTLAPIDVPPQPYQWNLRVKPEEPEILPWPTPPVYTQTEPEPDADQPAKRRFFRRG